MNKLFPGESIVFMEPDKNNQMTNNPQLQEALEGVK